MSRSECASAVEESICGLQYGLGLHGFPPIVIEFAPAYDSGRIQKHEAVRVGIAECWRKPLLLIREQRKRKPERALPFRGQRRRIGANPNHAHSLGDERRSALRQGGKLCPAGRTETAAIEK